MAQPGFEPRSVRLKPRASPLNYHAHCLLDEVQPDLVPASSSWSIQPGLLPQERGHKLPGDAPCCLNPDWPVGLGGWLLASLLIELGKPFLLGQLGGKTGMGQFRVLRRSTEEAQSLLGCC